MDISQVENQEIAKFNEWLDKNSEGKPIIGLESGCKSLSNPPPPCICPTPDGDCLYVNPDVICYNGTQPFCP